MCDSRRKVDGVVLSTSTADGAICQASGSAFVLYRNATRAQLRATHPELTTSRQIGEAHAAGWKKLSDKEVLRPTRLRRHG